MSFNIHSTQEYSQFKYFQENRHVLPNHVENIKDSIKKKNKLHLNPIIVSQGQKTGKFLTYLVIDGQHRLEAAKSLKLPIYYTIDNNYEINDVIMLNSTRRNWKLEDYIDFHAQQITGDYPKFRELWEFTRKKNCVFSVLYNSVAVICKADRKFFPKRIREGNFSLKNIDVLESFLSETLDLCHSINRKIRDLKTKTSSTLFLRQAYIHCLCTCYAKMSKKEYEILWECLNRDYMKFTDTNSTNEVFKLFEISYNFKKSTQRFDFSVFDHTKSKQG